MAPRGPDDEARDIQAAVRVALLDYNDQVSRDYNTASYLATSENGVLYRQPIDETRLRADSLGVRRGRGPKPNMHE